MYKEKVPEILYKYSTAETTIRIIENGKLRWSSPCQFNDTNELQRMPVLEPSIEDGWEECLKKLIEIAFDKKVDIGELLPLPQLIISMIRISNITEEKALSLFSELKPEPNLMDKVLRENTENYNDGTLRIMCLSEECNNDAMWAHYTNNEGCVLGFRHLPEFDTPFQEAKKVQYIDGNPVVGSLVDFLLYGIPDIKEKTIDAIYYSKSKNWSYEREWRLMSKRPSEKGKLYSDFKFYKEELESITFGPRIREKDYKNIKETVIFNYPKCDLYRTYNYKGSLKREKL